MLLCLHIARRLPLIILYCALLITKRGHSRWAWAFFAISIFMFYLISCGKIKFLLLGCRIGP